MHHSCITVSSPSLRRTLPRLHFAEFTLAALAWAAFLIALLALTGAYLGLQRWFWLDEAITAIIARDPSSLHAFHSLTAGLDSNLPGLYLILRLLKSLGLPMTETPLHTLSLLSLFAFLLGLYTLLRLSFDRLTSAAAVLPLLLVPTLVGQSFEIRFYLLWSALCIWFALTLIQLRLSKKRFTPWHVAALLLTLLTLTIHYFGIITLALMLACDWFADPRPSKRKLTARWPILLGLLPALLIPWFYLHQRQMLATATWSDPITLPGTLLFLQEIFQINHLALLILTLIALWLLARFLPRQTQKFHLRRVPLKHLHLLAPLAGLLAWPLIMILLSLTMQPILLPRYALPALGGLSLLLALLLCRLPKFLTAALLVLCLSAVIQEFNQVAPRTLQFVSAFGNLGLQLESDPLPEPILFEGRHDLYPTFLYFPHLQSRMFFLDFQSNEESPATLARSGNFMLFERDAQRTFTTHYPALQSFPKSRLNELPSFIFVPFRSPFLPSDPQRIQARFPGWQIQPLQGHLFRLTKPTS